MRRRSATAAAAALCLVALSGCGMFGSDSDKAAKPAPKGSRSAAPSPPAVPSPSPLPRVVPPPAAAGPACAHLTYETVEASVGTRFEVAAASGEAAKETACVLQRRAERIPTLTYVNNPVTADAEAFGLDFQPNGSKPVAGLGKAAYSKVAVGAAGEATIEVGWLLKSSVRILTLVVAANPAEADGQKSVDALVALAKQLPA